jgi:hypothetical protein
MISDVIWIVWTLAGVTVNMPVLAHLFANVLGNPPIQHRKFL